MKNETTGLVELGNWYAVAAVAVASLGMAGGLTEADAMQVVVTPVGGPATAPTSGSFGGVVFNLLDSTGTQWHTVTSSGGGFGHTSFGIGWRQYSNGASAFVVGHPFHGSVLMRSSATSYAAKLGNGRAVGDTQFGPFFSNGSPGGLLGSSSSGHKRGRWKPGDDKFVGLNLYNVGVSNASYFGWAEIQLGSTYKPTLVAWGFNDDHFGTAYTPGEASPVPEPSSLLLLASGAAGLAAYRKRRAKRRAEAV